MFWSCLSSSLAQGSHWRSILAKNHDSSMPSFCALLLAGARFIYSSNLLVVALTFTFFLATYLPSRKSVALLKLVRHDEISRIQLQALERTGVKSTVGCINVQVNMPYISFHPFTPPKKPNLSEVGFKPPNLWDFETKIPHHPSISWGISPSNPHHARVIFQGNIQMDLPLMGTIISHLRGKGNPWKSSTQKWHFDGIC